MIYMNNQKSEGNQIKRIIRAMRIKQQKTIEQVAEELGVARQIKGR